MDTGDLVQETLMKAFVGLDKIEVRGPGIFQAYVRKAILNRIRDELRRGRNRTDATPTEHIVDRAPSPLEHAIGADVVDRYERAMAQLSEEERRLLHLRIELDYSFEEIAMMLERTGPDAVRMAARRAMSKLSKIMGHER
jgi:RNA polymerase sigma-70 factor (ECF subfamily)